MPARPRPRPRDAAPASGDPIAHALLTALAGRTANAVVVTDAARRITWVNDGFVRLTGWTLEEARGQSPGALLQTAETDPSVVTAMRVALDRGERFRGELLNRSRDGRDYWLDLEITPHRAADGTLLGFTAIEADITESKSTQLALEAALRHRDALFATLEAHFIVSRTDAVGRITDVNEAFTHTFGRPREAVLGHDHRCISSGLHPAAFWEEMWRTIAAGRPWRGEVADRAADGRLVWLDSVIAPVCGPDGQVEEYVAIRRDITARKALETTLERTSALLTSVLDATAGVAVIATDPEFLVTVFNAAAERLLGGATGDVVGQVTPLRWFDPDEVTERATALGQALERPATLAEAFTHPLVRGRPRDWTVVRPSGQRIPVSVTVTAMHGDPLAAPIGYVILAHDVREQRAAERALRDARARAEAAAAAKGRFVANISHELRTPMNAVLGLLTLLARTDLVPPQRHYLQQTERAARSLLRLLDDILDFARLEEDKVRLESHPFRLTALLRDLAVLLEATVGEKPLALRVDVDAHVPSSVRGDRHRLQQVLVNLGGNAIKFTPAGEVVISVRVVGADAGSVALAFAVRDTGIGITEEQRARIFESFEQAEADTTRRFGGSGLGLTISRRLVTLMGGTLTVESTPGAGSTFAFTLTLPVADAVDPVRAAGPVAPPAGAPRLAGRHLLVVEDNDINQMVAHELLAAEGATVTVAEHGAAAVRAVLEADRPYDAVLMDLQMPVMDGFAATRAIRDHLGDAAPPIIAMTANALDTHRQACLEAGMHAHVGKPFDLGQLTALLAALPTRERAAPVAARAPARLPQPTAAAPVFDHSAVLRRLSGDRALVDRLIQRFRVQFADAAGTIEALVAGGDLTGARHRAHQLAGAAATLGMPDVASSARALEAGAAHPDATVPALAPAIAALRERLGEALVALALAVPTPAVPTHVEDPPPLSAPPDEPFQRTAARLATALEHRDLQARRHVAQLAGRWPDGTPLSLVAQLTAQVEALDFPAARATLGTLLEALA
jgi:PAS domain S-box-containing protein